MATKEAHIKLAESLKDEGNEMFRRGKFRAAIEKYTESITFHREWAVPFVNRALCHKKLENWEAVKDDCRVALQLQSTNLKAQFFLGQALHALGHLAEAIPPMTRALEAARDSHDSLKDDIWQELARCKYALWSAQARARAERHTYAEKRMRAAFDALHERERAQAEGSSEAQRAEVEQQHARDRETTDEVLELAAKRDAPEEPASAFTCQLTMDIFREPVMTPSGISYESSALQEHLKKVGMWDPVTRQPITSMDQLVVNAGLRAATQEYLEEHPWAWQDIYA